MSAKEKYLAIKLSDLELMSGAKDPSSGRSEAECLLRSWLEGRDIEAHYLELPQPAQQHQGEPVALPEKWSCPATSGLYAQGQVYGWNACLDKITKLGPLYSRPVQAAMWQKAFNVAIQERDTLRAEVERLRAQLDERDHQLGLIGTCLGEILVAAKHIRAGVGLTGPQLLQFGEELRDCLSASAEPSAPACLTCKGSGLEYDSGAAHPCSDCKTSAPVEIDERAEFEAKFTVPYGVSWDSEDERYYDNRYLDEGGGDYQPAWEAWQARAALERKP